MSCAMCVCESYGVQLRPAVGVFVVPYGIKEYQEHFLGVKAAGA